MSEFTELCKHFSKYQKYLSFIYYLNILFIINNHY